MSSAAKPKILCIDDDVHTLDALERDLRPVFDVSKTSDVSEIPKLLTKDTALVICDYNLGEINGLQVFEKIRDLYPSCMRILLTGQVDLDDIAKAIHSHLIHKFILKPWDGALLKLHMIEAVGIHRLLHERDKFKELSLTDPVTELTNHRFFQEKLRLELQKAKSSKKALSLVMIDVDHFKLLNDQFGHPRGDQILNLIAKNLSSHLKPHQSLSRYGGEEFGLILPQTSEMPALALAETLRKSIFEIREAGFRLSISLGVASFPEHGLDADELLAIADQALYCAKRQGRNMTVVGPEN